MRGFDYRNACKELASSVPLSLICRIHGLEGELRALACYCPSLLGGFMESARLLNTVTFSKSSKLRVSESRVKDIVFKKEKPENSDELLAFAYCDIIKDIAVMGAALNPAGGDETKVKKAKETGKRTETITLGDLNSIDVPTVAVMGGVREAADARKTSYSASVLTNIFRYSADLRERDNQSMVNEMIADFNHVVEDKFAEPLLPALCFEMDYSFIQREQRKLAKNDHILLLLLLRRAGFVIGNYISIEKLLEECQERSEEAFAKSTKGWMDGGPDYTPYVTLLLEILIEAYQRLFATLPFSGGKRPTRSNVVLDFITERQSNVSKKDIMSAFPWISQKSVERSLKLLQEDNKIAKEGKGRASTYKINNIILDPKYPSQAPAAVEELNKLYEKMDNNSEDTGKKNLPDS